MKPTHMVYAILAFGLIMAITIPHFMMMATRDNITYEAENKEELASTTETVNSASKVATKASSLDVAIATPSIEEKPVEVKEEQPVVQEEPKEEVVQDPIVYDGLTMEQLVNKLNKSLHSTLSGTGNIYAKYALENGVDPYLAVAITLHETGCKWNCSSNVRQCNNVGGMKSGGSGKCNGTSYAYFETLDAGIRAFIVNLKENYYDKGLNTPELMNKKYASSSAWAGKINSYINYIKNS